MRSPVFRHAGSWRHAGTTRRSPQMPPRRWWQAIMAPQTICYIIYNQDNTHQTTAGAQPRTASGVRFRWCDLVRPACRHDPAWRNTGLRTAATACRGGGNARLRSSSPPTAQGRTLRLTESHEVACLNVTTLHLRSCVVVAECLPRLCAEGTLL